MLALLNAILGAALLFIGRKLFWFFVGAIGFAVGIQLTSRYLHGRSELFMILVGLVVGVLFALLAIFLQGVAIGAAGFFGGGYVLLGLAAMFGMDRGAFPLIIFVVGGILGVLLVGFLFEWALITLSSLAGASLVVAALSLERAAGGVLLLVLFVIGVAVQGAALRNEKRSKLITE